MRNKNFPRKYISFCKNLKNIFLGLAITSSLSIEAQTSSLKLTSPYYTPDHGYSVGGTATLAVQIADASTVDKVEFYVDGKLEKTLHKYPYSCQWSGSRATTGLHQVEVLAYMKKGEVESILQAFTVEAASSNYKDDKQAAVTKDAEGVFYKLDALANSHAANHIEGLSLWKSINGVDWSYAGLIWSFEGDANET